MTGKRAPVTPETYIRVLPFSVVKYLSLLLDIDGQWQKLVLAIPRSLKDIGVVNAEMRYSQIQVRLFESKGQQRDGSPTRAILDDWGTQNTKVKHLLQILQIAALYESADYISVNVLHGEKVPRHSTHNTNVASLPQPGWNKEKTDEKKQGKEAETDLINFDGCEKKTMYQKGCSLSHSDDSSGFSRNHVYNRLSHDGSGDHQYNKLIDDGPEGPAPINYNRIPSYDSGGHLSDLLQNANPPNKSSQQAQEHEEQETLQVRPCKDYDDYLKPTKPGMDSDYLKPLGRREIVGKDVEVNSEPPTDKMAACNLSKHPPVGANIKEDVSVRKELREPSEATDGTASVEGSLESIYVRTGSKQMEYKILAEWTDNFNIKPFNKGGRVIGAGGFGDVFLGILNAGNKVAVKRLKNTEGVDKQFVSELDALVKYHHDNIVRLYGYSIDGEGKCLVYEYLCNGSLEDRLMLLDGTPPLPVATRLSILKGTAEGINFLNSRKIVHRDLKSANILLDENFKPKVGDFATVRSGPKGQQTTMMQTQVVIGTKAYLAPEAMNFDVSTKLDSFSFGIVILEVLTGLPAMDEEREDKDIKCHIDECGINEVLDETGGSWGENTVSKLMEISEKCSEYRKKIRVNVSDIIEDLRAISSKCDC